MYRLNLYLTSETPPTSEFTADSQPNPEVDAADKNTIFRYKTEGLKCMSGIRSINSNIAAVLLSLQHIIQIMLCQCLSCKIQAYKITVITNF
jgi:hypothetical protein